MTVRNGSGRQAALLKARERRQALDRERDAKDQQIEEAAAAVLLAIEERDAAQRALDEAAASLGKAVSGLLKEGVDAPRAAALVELDPTEIRRLARSRDANEAATDMVGHVRLSTSAEASGAARLGKGERSPIQSADDRLSGRGHS